MKACLVFCGWIGTIGNQSKFPLNNRNNMRKKTTSSCGIEFLQFLPTTVFNVKQKITTEIYVEDYKLIIKSLKLSSAVI